MVTGDEWREAVALATDRPGLSVGLHLVLVRGASVLPHPAVPRLVDPSGRFRESPTRAGLVYRFDANARRQVRREIRAQLERFRETGLPLGHVDGHLHLHVHPVVIDAIAELAHEFGIPSVRLPSEELAIARALDPGRLAGKLAAGAVFALLRRRAARRLRAAGVRVPDRVYGLHQTGRVSEGYLLELLPRISAEWSEIYCHPAHSVAGEPRNGPPGSGEQELAALLSPRVRRAVDTARLALEGSREAAAGTSGATSGAAPAERREDDPIRLRGAR